MKKYQNPKVADTWYAVRVVMMGLYGRPSVAAPLTYAALFGRKRGGHGGPPVQVHHLFADSVLAYVDELPGAITEGETIEEARENLQDAVNELLASRSHVGPPRYENLLP